MATKARQQYFADEISLQKQSREFSISDEIQQKIDGIEEGAQVNVIETIKVNGTSLIPDIDKAVNVEVPEVIDNLYTVDSDNALSAKQGKLLYDYIQNIASRGRFLSNWNSATGLPMTNPSESPYPYKSGDYFVVSNVAGLGGTNYRPDGSSYIIGQASTVVETESVDVSDFYFYDGTTWLLLKNSSRSWAVDSALSTTSTNPVENRVITNALNGKQETLIAGNNIQIAADGKTISATDTTYSAGTNISIDANNEISAVDTTYTAGTNVQISAQNVISATDTKYTAGTGISIDANNEISNTLPGAIVSAIAPSNPIEGMLWYDTANDELKAYNGTSWETEGTKMVVLEYGVSTWQDFINAYNENAIVYCKVSSGTSGYRMAFMAYTAGTTTPTEVEFQYYRSRSSHSTAANQLDEVYVYKLTNAGVWTTTQRATGAEMIAGTGIGITFNSSGATINNTGVTSFNGSTGAVTVAVPTNTSDLTNDSGFITSSDIPTNVSDFTNDAGYLTSSTGVTSFNGSTGAITYTAPVTNVNGNTGAVIVSEVPGGGTEGQVLTQTNNGPAWQNATGGADIEYVTQAEYNALLPGAASDGKHYFIYSTSGGGGWQPGANTIAWYPLDSTDELSDMKGSGTAYDLTATGGTPTYSTHYATLDGSTHLQSNLASMSGASTISFSGWVNFASFSSGNVGICITGTASFNGAITVAVEPSGKLIVTNYGTGPSVSTPIYLQTDTWYNIGLSYANGTWRLYVNGQLVSNYNWSHTISADFTKFNISGYPTNSELLPNGTKIGSIAVQNNEMSAQDFLDFYDGTKANYGL